MTTLTRAVTAIRRKKIKTLIMFLIMSVIFSGIAGGVSVHKAMTLLKSKVDENVNSAVSLEGKNKVNRNDISIEVTDDNKFQTL